MELPIEGCSRQVDLQRHRRLRVIGAEWRTNPGDTVKIGGLHALRQLLAIDPERNTLDRRDRPFATTRHAL